MYFKKTKKNTSTSEDVAAIRAYLTQIGDLSATDEEIEDSYAYFSENKYAAGWMRLDNKLLDEFATWLDSKYN